MHRVEPHFETGARQQFGKALEIEQRLHKFRVVRHRIHHLDLGLTKRDLAQSINVDVGLVHEAIGGYPFAACVDGLGQRFRGGTPGGRIVLYPEIALRPAGVMTGREYQPAIGTALTDKM